MANPQKEDGHTDIANEILEALWKVNLSAYETRVLIFLLRKTYGWHKKVDAISLSQFEKAIGLDRRLIHRTLKELSSKGMILVIPQDDRKPVSYGFQKDYQKWKLSSPKMTHHRGVIPRDDKTIIPQDDALSSQGIPTKETNTKETNTKEKVLIPFSQILSYLNEKTGKNFSLKAKEHQRHIRARWNEGKREEDFKKVIDIKFEKWGTDEKMVDYLRPETLFGTKMDSYLNENPGTLEFEDRRMYEIEQLRKKNEST